MNSLNRLNFFRDRFNVISFIECKKVVELLNKNGCEFSHIIQGNMSKEIKLVFIDKNYNEFTFYYELRKFPELSQPLSHYNSCFLILVFYYY